MRGTGALSASFQTVNELRFDNTYSTGEPITVFLAGTKDLQVEEGASLVDIEGKFRFAISTKDIAAPMPESTDAGNGQWGRIEFGFITFSLQDLNKALDVDSDSAEKAAWSRSHVFKYKVTERGSVPGVVNDPNSTSGGVSASTTVKTGDAALTLAVVLAAVVGLAMAIAGLACGRGCNHKK